MLKNKLLQVSAMILISFPLFSQTSIPFTETWESGSFETNGWTVTQGSGQCLFADEGYNGGKAIVLGHTSAQQGTESVVLESPLIDASGQKPGILYFSFNYSLNNPDTTEWPLLRVLYDEGDGWKQLIELGYDSSYSWREFKTDLMAVHGKQFRLRFEAVRIADSINGRWYIDNIRIHDRGGIVFGLQATAINSKEYSNYGAQLNWEKPVFDTTAYNDSSSVFYYQPETPSYWGAHGFLGYGVGILIKNDVDDALLYQVSFRQHPLVEEGRFPFNIHIVDWVNKTYIKSLGPFLTKASSGWEVNIPLNLTSVQSVDTIGIFMEPLAQDPNYNGLPCLRADGKIDSPGEIHPYRVSIADLHDYYDIFYLMRGNAYMRVTLLTPEGKQITVDPSTYDISRWQQSLPLNYTPMASVEGSVTEWTDTEVTKGWYSYYVTANYPDGSTVNSDTVAIEMPSGQGIDSPARNAVEVVPNPIHNNILRLSGAESVVSAVVSDLTGRRLAVVTDRSALLNGISLGHLAPGHYLVQISLADGKTVGRKFVIE